MMRFIWISVSFLLGVFTAKNLVHFEHSGEGDSEFNFYFIFGFINNIYTEFEEEVEYIADDEEDEDDE